MSKTLVPDKIGKIKIHKQDVDTDNEYSDGDSENTLLTLFKKENHEELVRDLLSQELDWAIKYHIAYTRENLLNWFEFDNTKSLLEIGAGCGALTGLFSRKCKNVVALDISERRSLINAYRHKNRNNIDIIIGNLENHSATGVKYDFITSIGVLEYAGRFISDKEPFKKYLEEVKKNLKANGTLILAIENRFGIKYWSGSKEDHTGRMFDSIEGYPNSTGITTFGKKELTRLLTDSGFGDLKFYYPFPDYKMPVDIYSDEYSPGSTGKISSDLFPTPAPDQKREYLFDEALAMQNIVDNGLFSDFSNSFLVFARNS